MGRTPQSVPSDASDLAQRIARESLLGVLRRERPRLIATPGAWEAIRAARKNDALLDGFLKRGEFEARALLDVPPVEYKKTGRRLLSVSRQALRRVLLLALHHRLTGDPALARRAEREMLAAAAFRDWNPSHFLDVGEMTAALAFGYDWLFDALTPDARKTIAAAIVEKGLRPGLDPKQNHFTRSGNNWNSVCLAGLTLGALALAEEETDLAARTVAQTLATNDNGLKPYAPDGVYPEGAMYWGYGTSFQAVLVAALESALGSDGGLSRAPGFRESGAATVQQRGPTGLFFNFSDGTERTSLEAGIWWYAKALNRPDLVRAEREWLKEYAARRGAPSPDSQSDRLLPLAALWWPTGGEGTRTAPAAPAETAWYGRGPNELAVFRTAWDDPKAAFLALKAGGASLSHAHMDAGSFVYEANGVRWACDLGLQSYESLESKGVDLWNKSQNGDRWRVYRLGPVPHNTLTIGGQLHRADGLAKLTHFGGGAADRGAVVDLTPVFKGQATRVARGFAFRPDRGGAVVLRDEVEGVRPGDDVRWAFLTRAEVSLSASGDEATLTEKGQRLRVRLRALPDGDGGESAPAARLDVAPADPPPGTHDAPNPGYRLLTARVPAPPSGRVTLVAVLEPSGGGAPPDPLETVALRRWPLPPARRA